MYVPTRNPYQYAFHLKADFQINLEIHFPDWTHPLWVKTWYLILLLVGGGGESAPRLIFLLSTENGLTRAPLGGIFCPPLSNIRDNLRTT